MSSYKCQHKPKANYEVKQRYIPTFEHQQIFYEEPLRPYSSRCTPTFHSTVFDTEGYNIKTFHQKNQQPPRPITTNVTIVDSRVQNEARTQNTRMNASTDKWFDHTKEQVFLSIKDGQNHGYSRERKYVDLSSDLVFTDYNYESKAIGNLQPVNNKQFVRSIAQNQQQSATQQSKKQGKNQIFELNEDKNHLQGSRGQQKVSLAPEQDPSHTLKAPQSNKTPKIKNNSKPQKDRQLKLKGKQIPQRPQTAHKTQKIQQKPTFTVVRKSRVQH